MDLPQYFRLNNNEIIPAVGLGTFQGNKGNSDVKEAVKLALKLGYRHIDGASAYGNEKEIGEAIKESAVPRGEIFVTSKLAQTWHEPADVEKALEASLKHLQLDYVDLYLMHCMAANPDLLEMIDKISSNTIPHAYKAGPNNETIRHPSGNGKPVIDYELSRRYPETWKAMERLVSTGKTRSIGLSNFNILKTRRILEVATIIPAVNQVEVHPYFPQQDLLDFSVKHGILLMAHQPLGGRPVPVVRGHPDAPFPTEDPEVIAIADRCGLTPAQVCLSWAVQRGIPIVPKSIQEAHMKQNIELKLLPPAEFNAVDKLSSKAGPLRYLDPSQHLGFDIFDEEADQPLLDIAPWDT